MKHYWTTKDAALAAVENGELVALATGRTLRAVYSFRHRNGLTSANAFTADDDDYIVRARANGLTWHEIAMHLGRTAGSCSNRMQRIRARKCRQ